MATGPEEQEEVRDGGRGGEEEADVPEGRAFPSLGLRLLPLTWLRRPHLVRPQHPAPPDYRAGWGPGQHSGGQPGGREHLTRRQAPGRGACTYCGGVAFHPNMVLA